MLPLEKIRQHRWKGHAKITKLATLKSDLLKTNQYIAPKRRFCGREQVHFLHTKVCKISGLCRRMSSLALDVSPLKTRKPTVWHEILAGFNFYDFPAIRKGKFPQIKITGNVFAAKVHSRVNIL